MFVYADYNATSPMSQVAKESVFPLMHLPLNASSLHRYGVEARNLLESVRENVLLSKCFAGMQLLFTSSGTEANNMLINSFPGHRHLFSCIEHKSVLECFNHDNGYKLPVTSAGTIDLNALESTLKELDGEPLLVSVMMANNETGIIQPIENIAELCSQWPNVIFHTDASQYLGKLPWNFMADKVDAITLSGHKIGAGLGVGILLFWPFKVQLKTLIRGGGQEQGLRGGTENVMAIAAFGAAFGALERRINMHVTHVLSLRERLEQGIMTITGHNKDLIVGYGLDRLPNTSCIVMPGVNGLTQLIYFDLNGIAVSSGAACTSRTVEESHVLKAMNLPDGFAKYAIRVSLGPENTMQEIDYFLDRWSLLYKKHTG